MPKHKEKAKPSKKASPKKATAKPSKFVPPTRKKAMAPSRYGYEEEEKPAKPAAKEDKKAADEPKKADDKPEEVALDKAQALNLFINGVHLKKKGDEPDKWFAVLTHMGKRVLIRPLSAEDQEKLLSEDLVLAE
jgi:hypothetical protein